MLRAAVLKLSFVVITSLTLMACGGSSGSAADQNVGNEENTGTPQKPPVSIYEISNETVIANGGGVQATQPTLEKNSEAISTTTQSTATSLGLNTENRFSIPENNNSIWMKYRGEKEG